MPTPAGTASRLNWPDYADSVVAGIRRLVTHVFADSGYRGIAKWSRRKRIRWAVAMTPSHRRALDPSKPLDALKDKAERIKASIRAKVEHPFRVLKRQFCYVKARYRGLAKNAAQVTTLFMLSNLWMVRRKLAATG